MEDAKEQVIQAEYVTPSTWSPVLDGWKIPPPKLTDEQAEDLARQLQANGTHKEADIDCVDCRGRGFTVVRGTPLAPEFGKPMPCKCVERNRQSGARARLLSWCEMAEPMTRKTFEGFAAKPWQHEAKQIAFAYATGKLDTPWLVLGGSNGTGKTHLGLAILNWRREHREDGLPMGKYVNVPDLLDDLKGGYEDGSYQERLDRYLEAPLLLLDDIGAAKPTLWVAEKLYQLLDHRSRERMETVITTDTRAADLPARIADRVQDVDSGLVTLVRLVGESQRSGLTW